MVGLSFTLPPVAQEPVAKEQVAKEKPIKAPNDSLDLVRYQETLPPLTAPEADAELDREVHIENDDIGLSFAENTLQLQASTEKRRTADQAPANIDIAPTWDAPIEDSPAEVSPYDISDNVFDNLSTVEPKTEQLLEKTPELAMQTVAQGSSGLDDWIFEGGSDSLVAHTVGHAEGTRQWDGQRTKAYYGHVDPGNGVWNLGTFSYQHGAATPEDADEKQLQRLKRQGLEIEAQAADHGLKLSLEERINAIDLANQAPLAALDRGGYIDQLAKAYRLKMNGTEAILWARTNAYLDPDTQMWNAPGLGNNVTSISKDQARRMLAIEKALHSYPQNNLWLAAHGKAAASEDGIDLAGSGAIELNNSSAQLLAQAELSFGLPPAKPSSADAELIEAITEPTESLPESIKSPQMGITFAPTDAATLLADSEFVESGLVEALPADSAVNTGKALPAPPSEGREEVGDGAEDIAQLAFADSGVNDLAVSDSAIDEPAIGKLATDNLPVDSAITAGMTIDDLPADSLALVDETPVAEVEAVADLTEEPTEKMASQDLSERSRHLKESEAKRGDRATVNRSWWRTED
ncbi:MAG: hypothetical protein WA885_06330 [Phormidesmis sp.]